MKKSNFGIIKWYDKRGYGVIYSQKEEYFFREGQLKISYEHITEGTKCMFKPQLSSFKKTAIDVIIIPNYSYDHLKSGLFDKDNFIECFISNLDEPLEWEETVLLLNILKHLNFDTKLISKKLFEKILDKINSYENINRRYIFFEIAKLLERLKFLQFDIEEVIEKLYEKFLS